MCVCVFVRVCVCVCLVRYWLYLSLIPFNIGVTVTVDDSIRYIVNEDEGLVNITILLDQPSCVPITVIARPQVRSPLSATGKITD